MRRLLCCLIFLLYTPVLWAQDITGIWEAKSEKSLWVLNISDNGQYETRIDDPTHDIYGVASDRTRLKKDSLFIDISLLRATYKAKWNLTDSIKGMLIYQGSEHPLNFKRISLADKNELKVILNRPQTPKPPFNYVTEDVKYKYGEMLYGATFTKPYGNGKFPTVLIVNGWVLEDRNGNIYGHKSNWVLADYLTRSGFAVLRVDGRGTGMTSLGKKRSKFTSARVSYDLKSSLDYLRIRPDVDLNRLGLLAQRDGGAPAEIIAARKRENIKFLVLWGVPVLDGIQREILPSINLLTQKGIDTASISAYAWLKTESLQALLSTDNKLDIDSAVNSIFYKWEKYRPAGTISKLNKYTYDLNEYAISNWLKNVYDNAQWRFNVGYEPKRYIKKINCPILVLIGERDTETPAIENLKAVQDIVDSCGKKNIEMKMLPGLNHILQTSNTGEISEYMTITETIAPSAMKIIADWIKIHTK